MLQWFKASLIAFLFSGCAYSGGFGARALPGGYTLLSVPTFKNQTQEAGAEVYFTNAIRRELERSKRVKLENRSESQATLEGSLERVQYFVTDQRKAEPGNFLPPGTVLNTSYRILVTTRLVLRRNSDQSILWTGQLERERGYNAPIIGTPGVNSANALYHHSVRYQLLAQLAQEMMAEAHDRLMEGTW